MVAPNFNDLKEFKAVMPHPKGEIIVDLKKEGEKVTGDITLPKGTTGLFKYKDKEVKLKEGNQCIK